MKGRSERAVRGWRLYLTMSGGVLAAAAVLLAARPLVAGDPPSPRAAPAIEAGETTPRPGGRLVIGVRGDVSSFNIYTARNAFTMEIADLLYPKLAWEQDDFRQGPPSFAPGIARSWELTDAGRTLTFRLDPSARWADGTPITSWDVLFSHEAARSAQVGWVGREVKEFIEQVTAPDPTTVVYRFSRAYPYQLMDAAEGNILPRAAYGAIPFPRWPEEAFQTAPIPGGPFRLKRYERGALIELERNPHYHGAPRPHLEQVAFRIIPDEAMLVNELLAGGIDVMENVPEDAAARVEASPRLRLVSVPDLSYTYICWNTSRPLLADARVRRALTLAIDRQAIIEGLVPRTGRPSAGPILSFLWAADPGLAPSPYDPAGARKLLAEAGWADSDGDGLLDRQGQVFRFELETNQGSGLRQGIVEMVAAQLRQVGVEAVPRFFDFGTFIDRHEQHEFDAFVGSWRESTKVDLRSAFHSASRDGGYNYGLYANEKVDALIDQARAEADPAVAGPLWREAQRLIVEDAPYTFLLERDRLHAAPRDLQGFAPGPRSAFAGLAGWRRDAGGTARP